MAGTTVVLVGAVAVAILMGSWVAGMTRGWSRRGVVGFSVACYTFGLFAGFAALASFAESVVFAFGCSFGFLLGVVVGSWCLLSLVGRRDGA